MEVYKHAKNMVFLAPLAGITDRAFREVCAENGAGLTFTEMISAKGIKYNNRKTYDLLSVSETEGRVGVQLFGNEADTVSDTAKTLEQSCGDRIALFDVNMGCPAPKIVNNGEGCSLMKQPELAASIIAELVKKVSIPVTAKFRKGFDANSVNAVEFALRLEDAGVSAITVHGRTREQFYEGKADWDIIAEVKRRVRIPVIANGDIFTPEDAKNILAHTGADGIMVARGALGNPQIFTMINDYLTKGEYKAATAAERLTAAKKQAAIACAEKGERVAVKELRKHACWYLKGMRGGARLRERAVKAETLADLEALFDEAAMIAEENNQ